MNVRTATLTLSLLMASHALAGTVGFRVLQSGTLVNSGSFTVSDTAPYTAITIPLGTSIVSNTDVHIFTSGGGSGASVGQVTITGSMGSPFIPVRVAIVDEGLTVGPSAPGFQAAFDFPRDEFEPGLRNVGGITFSNPNDANDHALRDQAVLAATIRGDLAGNVTVGQIHRVDVLRQDETSPFFGGTISGNVTSTSNDIVQSAIEASNPCSAEFIRAGWQITGNITAQGPTGVTFDAQDRATWGSIGTVVIGPSLAAPGLTGAVSAEKGVIREIVSTGQIGAGPLAVQRAQVTAGVRLGRITTRASDAGTLLQVPIYADIETSARDVASDIPFRQSSLSLIETAGDFVGSLKVLDFFGLNDQSGPQRASGRKGIFVGGKFEGDIDVTYNWQYGDMVARSFRGDITIGQMLKGAIVAVGTQGSTDTLDGTIGSVTVGYSEDLSGSPRPNAPGFNATQTLLAPAPFEGADRDNWYTMAETDFRTVDGLIRADKSIGIVELKAMSNRLPEIGGKVSRARVESPHIGTLRIDHFDTGSVWSGKINWNPATQAIDNDMADDYAAIDHVEIGCMGPKADLWVKDALKIDITGDIFGEVHVPAVEVGQIIRIGGRFGDTEQALSGVALCGADGTNAISGYGIFNNEATPRGVWSGVDGVSATHAPGVPDFGRILIQREGGLHGQIILDAANDTQPFDTSFWKGDVLVGFDPGVLTPVVFSTDAARATSPAHAGPYYAEVASQFGGGAIGLTPFPLARQDCEPYSACETLFCTVVPVVTTDRLDSSGEGIRLRFYGPVALQTGPSLHLYKTTAHGAAITSADYAAQLGVTVGARELIVHGPTTLDPGRYVIVHAVSDTGLVCDHLFNGAHPVVPPFKYHFVLTDPSLTSDAGCTDYNGDGDHGTDQDIEAFFACIAGNCCPTCFGQDFNCDGDFGTDADIEEFFRVLASGVCQPGCN